MPVLFMALGAALGVVAALVCPGYIPNAYTTYVAVAILAALDSVVGAINAHVHKRFSLPVFVSGFFINTLLAAALTYVGELLQIDLYLAAVVVFGARIFQNFADLRRFILKCEPKIDKI